MNLSVIAIVGKQELLIRAGPISYSNYFELQNIYILFTYPGVSLCRMIASGQQEDK